MNPQSRSVTFRGGTIIDGTGAPPARGDVAIENDRIVAVGSVAQSSAIDVDVSGLVIAPGFVNTLSWASDELFLSGCPANDVRQGITLEVLGEGLSMGPVNARVAHQLYELQSDDAAFEVTWTTLDDFLSQLEQRGIAPNVASFVGATTLRIHVMGRDDRPADATEITQMCALARDALADGALGISSALVYPPGTSATRAELSAFARTCADSDAVYISHIRSESDGLLTAVDEFLDVVSKARVRGEVYHLKAKGEQNWGFLADALDRINAARDRGLAVTANMYPYTGAAATLDSIVPPEFHGGGRDSLLARLQAPPTRKRILEEMQTPSPDWDNTWLAAGSADNIILGSFGSQRLRALSGSTLSAVASQRNAAAAETALDLIVEDRARCRAIFLTQSEANVRKLLGVPWISVCTDGEGMPASGRDLHLHPRAFGSFPRVLGRYCREEQLLTLPEAIRRMTSLPATTYGLNDRGLLAPGYFADIVIFDPLTVQDRATYANPHRYPLGIVHVFVNGVAVVWESECTDARPGHVVRRARRRSDLQEPASDREAIQRLPL